MQCRFFFGFEIESGKELFVGLPTTLDLGFDWVAVRDVFHGLLFTAMEDDCKVFDFGLRVQCDVARSKDNVEGNAAHCETFRWNIRGGPRAKIDVQIVKAKVTMLELERVGVSGCVRAGSSEEFDSWVRDRLFPSGKRWWPNGTARCAWR